MSYSILGQNLHETADLAKKYFAKEYGARNFECEEAIDEDLPLKPTWQATLKAGYRLCIDVRETPFSKTLYEFVAQCASRGMPIRLWVAVPETAAVPSFNSELKQAHEHGVGVVQISDGGVAHVFHRPVPLSLYALNKTDLSAVPKSKRDDVKSAEETFLDGSPDLACHAICQALEQLTREFAEFTYEQGWWKLSGKKRPTKNTFQTGNWATVLELMEEGLDIKKVRAKCAAFSKQEIVKVRAHTGWRNSVSHKPKNAKQLKERDARLRTMFETTRDLLIEWYAIAKSFRLV